MPQRCYIAADGGDVGVGVKKATIETRHPIAQVYFARGTEGEERHAQVELQILGTLKVLEFCGIALRVVTRRMRARLS